MYVTSLNLILNYIKDKAFKKVFKKVKVYKFNIKEEIIIIFKNSLYNIINSLRTLVKKFNISNKLVKKKEVLTKY